jgi:hypothetical protein
LWTGVLKDGEMRSVEVVEAPLVQTLAHVPLHRLPRKAKERADERRAERFGRGSKGT